MVAMLFPTLMLLAAAASASEPLGSESSIEEFPSIAQVEVKVAMFWVQQCAASVLTNRHVLSAAFCFDGPFYFPEYRRIRVGTSERSSGGVVVGVESRVNHPNYGLLGSDADLAVIRLDDFITLGPSIQRVPILGQGIELPTGLRVLLAGWGTTVEGGEISNDNLYSLDLEVKDNEFCLEQYITSHHITENMVCVGLEHSQGRDFDSRDIGAPLYFSETLVGILSFGEEADDELPLVATNIGSYTGWIIENAV